ncbi:MAG: ribosome small subunit-dependent GTPase A [Candidatus Eisenbacteria bacterium]|nr:ribosome small subunit-dependent GTPase A [Candidatus Eisenbacteria bacterium]
MSKVFPDPIIRLPEASVPLDSSRDMELRDLGFDQWFREKQEELQKPDCSVARVTAVNRNNYLVRNENNELLAELAGSLAFSSESSMDFPSVGDWAFVQYCNSDTFAIIHELLPRKSVLRRKTPGKKIDYQVIASNIDVAFIVQSCDHDFSLRRLERYLVMVNEGRIAPMFLLTKSDLASPADVQQRMSEVRQANINCTAIALSNKTGFGLDQVRKVLEKGKTYCLLGSSGVGKTALLNNLIGSELFKTNKVRRKDGKGRHTTARRQLTILDDGAMLIDTPGMRELGNIAVTAGIDETFADIHELSKSCRFTDCAHTTETGCSLLMAVESGELSEARYQSYLKLLKESEYHEMSYVEKRKKDKAFGRFIKSAMKQHNKK